MSEQVFSAISEYGYWAIVALIFLQEVGIPNPVPNELVLLFSGYLAHTGILKLSLIILSAVLGDLAAATILFVVFYRFGNYLFNTKPAWLPLPWNKLEKLAIKMKERGKIATFLGRLAPFIKGYVTVLSGLSRYPAKPFSLILVSTSFLWACGYVLGGYLAGSGIRCLLQNHTLI